MTPLSFIMLIRISFLEHEEHEEHKEPRRTLSISLCPSWFFVFFVFLSICMN